LRRFSWGVSGGSITGLQNFLKDSLTIMKVCNQEVLSYPWYSYIMLLLAIATSFSGLLLLTACMKRYDATFSAAMFVGSFVISASIMSAVHYHTFQDLEHVYNMILYPLGLCILMTGVVVLAVDRADSTTNVCEEGELQSQGSKHESVHKMVMDTVSPARARFGSTEIRMVRSLYCVQTYRMQRRHLCLTSGLLFSLLVLFCTYRKSHLFPLPQAKILYRSRTFIVKRYIYMKCKYM
jgi:hypothetical protein